MNKVVLIGRLTRDPELRYTSSNVATVNFTVAVDRTFQNQNGEREADFINCVAWRKTAELIKNYLVKGSQIAVDGRIQTRSYDAQDGTKRYVTEVVCDNVQFLGRSNGASSDSQSLNEPSKEAFTDNATPYDFSSSNQPSSDPFSDFGNSIEISDDDLPF